MALQDLCGFQDSSLYYRWNSLRMAQEDTSIVFGKRTKENSSNALSWTNSPLNFYIPAAEYLRESPIRFGQMDPDIARSPTSLDDIFPSLSLPSGLPLFSCPSVPLPFPLSHGTTTLAFLFQGGVMAAADTRSSCSGLVACPASQKIIPIHSHLVGTTSGTSADCALWKRILGRELRLYQLRHGRRLSTGGAAKLLSHMLHPFKGTELCVAATLCGWDGGEVEACQEHEGREAGQEEEAYLGHEGRRRGPEEEEKDSRQTVVRETNDLTPTGKASFTPPVAWRKSQCLHPSAGGQQCSAGGRQGFSGPSLYYVCSDGTRLQGALFSVGSGSPYAYSVMDGGVQWGMSVPEATSLAREAVYRATHRDAYSGNCVDLYHITSKGWSRRGREELKEEYYREKERERVNVKERREREESIEYGERA